MSRARSWRARKSGGAPGSSSGARGLRPLGAASRALPPIQSTPPPDEHQRDEQQDDEDEDLGEDEAAGGPTGPMARTGSDIEDRLRWALALILLGGTISRSEQLRRARPG